MVNAPKRRFQLILIKPSHYHDDGYVIRWWRALIPSNSLAAMYGLGLDCAQRQVLGPDVEIDIEPIDETHTYVNVKKLIQRFRRHGHFGLVALVGVQSNQYPRALDIARPLRAAGVPVAIGGFHVSGCLAMLEGAGVGLELARELGISIFAGEAESRFEALLSDAARGAMKPLYNFMDDLPAIGGSPVPFLPAPFVKRVVGHNASFDAGRGCPFQCSFCTIINVQGRQSRYRSADDVEKVVRDNWAQGIFRFFITDDNFARNKQWESTFDRLAKLREVDGIPLGLMIQVDTLCHRIPNFVEKAKRAGVTRVFIGLENVNPDNLAAAKKKQNKITEYRKMLLAWKAQGILTFAGYILGFPADTPASIRQDIAIIQRELPLDILEFFILTPLPGSEDHQAFWRKGVEMDPDLNKYDLEHAVVDHPRMTRAELDAIYYEAWSLYYTPKHVETLMRRALVTKIPVVRLTKVLVQFIAMIQIEKMHPLQSGMVRVKHPSERRHGLSSVAPATFYLHYIRDVILNNLKLAATIWRLTRVQWRLQRDPEYGRYTDEALTAPNDDEDADTLDLLTKTRGAKAAISHQRKIEEITRAAARGERSALENNGRDDRCLEQNRPSRPTFEREPSIHDAMQRLAKW